MNAARKREMHRPIVQAFVIYSTDFCDCDVLTVWPAVSDVFLLDFTSMLKLILYAINVKKTAVYTPLNTSKTAKITKR